MERRSARNNNAKKYFARIHDAGTNDIVALDVNNKIHIFCGDSRKLILSCPTKPRVTELQRSPAGQWQIWCATDNSSLYRKSFSLSTDSHTQSGPSEEDAESNHSIFDDLLNNPKPAFLDFDVAPSKLSDDVFEIKEEDRMLHCDGEITAVCSTGELLCVMHEEKDQRTIYVYKIQEMSQEDSEAALKLPVPCHADHQGKSKDRPQLFFVTCQDEQGVSSSHIQVPPHLFSLIFGWQSTVRTLPVLLLTLPDHSVCFQTVDLTATSTSTSNWSLLCSLDSPVVEVFAIQVGRTLTEKESVAEELQRGLGLSILAPSHTFLDAFVVVAASGKCCLVTAVPALDARTKDYFRVVSLVNLPRAVRCACSSGRWLYVCSGRHLYRCCLTLRREEGEGRKHSVDVATENLHTAALSAMWMSGQGDTLHCETVNGDLVEFDTTVTSASNPNTTTGSNDTSGCPPHQSLKDLLVGVNVNQTKLGQMRSGHQQLNALLQQLNVASRLMHFHHPSTIEASHETAPITCKVTVRSEISYQAVNNQLVLQLTNHSTVALTQDWSLVLTLNKMEGRQSNSAVGSTMLDENLPCSYTFRMSHGLEAGHTAVFSIPLDYSRTFSMLSVNVFLVLHVSKPLPRQDPSVPASSDDLLIPLTVSVADVFHFMHLKQPGSAVLHTVDSSAIVEQKLMQINRSVPERSNRKDAEVKPVTENYSVSEEVTVEGLSAVEVLQELLRDSPVDIVQLTQACCILQDPCGQSLSLHVDQSADRPDTEGSIYTITAKSSSIALLAKTRLALLHRVQNSEKIRREANVTDFQKVISRTEVLQDQLQGFMQKLSGEPGEATTQVVTELCNLYKAMRSGVTMPSKDKQLSAT